MGAHHYGMDVSRSIFSANPTVLQDAINNQLQYDTAYQLTMNKNKNKNNRQGLHLSIEDHPSVDCLFHWQLSTVAS